VGVSSWAPAMPRNRYLWNDGFLNSSLHVAINNEVSIFMFIILSSFHVFFPFLCLFSIILSFLSLLSISPRPLHIHPHFLLCFLRVYCNVLCSSERFIVPTVIFVPACQYFSWYYWEYFVPGSWFISEMKQTKR